MLPDDIHPVSRCRVPPPKREDFDDAGKAVFDTYVDPKGRVWLGFRWGTNVDADLSYLYVAEPAKRDRKSVV